MEKAGLPEQIPLMERSDVRPDVIMDNLLGTGLSFADLAQWRSFGYPGCPKRCVGCSNAIKERDSWAAASLYRSGRKAVVTTIPAIVISKKCTSV